MRSIIVDPDPRLRKICADIEEINDYIKDLAKEMREYVLTHQDGCIGLSAPQLGEMVKLFVIQMENVDIVMINPRLLKTTGTRKVIETCLSLPGREYRVERPESVKMRGIGLDGETFTIRSRDLLAQCLIHEAEHLHGILLEDVALAEISFVFDRPARIPNIKGRHRNHRISSG